MLMDCKVTGAWTEAMQLMKEGDKWELYCKPELAYGARESPPKIPPNSVRPSPSL